MIICRKKYQYQGITKTQRNNQTGHPKTYWYSIEDIYKDTTHYRS